MNKVGSESLNLTVAKAAENIIDTKGVNGKQWELGGGRLHLQRLESGHRCKRWALRLDSFLLLAEGLHGSDSRGRRHMGHQPVLSQGEETGLGRAVCKPCSWSGFSACAVIT